MRIASGTVTAVSPKSVIKLQIDDNSAPADIRMGPNGDQL
jgi:hypothetical protein